MRNIIEVTDTLAIKLQPSSDRVRAHLIVFQSDDPEQFVSVFLDEVQPLCEALAEAAADLAADEAGWPERR